MKLKKRDGIYLNLYVCLNSKKVEKYTVYHASYIRVTFVI